MDLQSDALVIMETFVENNCRKIKMYHKIKLY